MMKRIVFFSAVVLVCCMNLFFVKEIFSQLIGNGIADDTQAIQVMLDSGEKLVYLPPPAKHYVISKPLRIYSNQTLKLDA
ncbi:MAG: glycoside hydrolase family 55 protein, partial [Planctomycetaceae bacterium]|nr:glycoside hydrolase family 55 protein [Planctomycetaceae bacterium]